jgi:DEAD/DEAH box helicase domain-containing protein
MARPVPENTDATFGCVFLLCGARDIGALARVRDPHFGMADLYIYDKYSGGTGLSEALYLRIPDVFTAAFETLSSCPCKSGCPSCVGPGEDKETALRFLEALCPPAPPGRQRL